MKIAAIQTASRFGDVEYNVSRAIDLARQAAHQGARLLAFPEFFACGSVTEPLEPEPLHVAETVDGPTITRMSQTNRELGVWLCVPLFEHDVVGGDAYFNAVFTIDPSSDVVAHYRKRFLPNRRANEQYLFSPGNLPSPVWDADDARFGVNICFERQFLKTARIPALEGADVLVHPSHTWGTGFGGAAESWPQQAAVWHVSTPSGYWQRAPRTCPVWLVRAARACWPIPEAKNVTILDDQEDILVCEIDPEYARETRRKARILVEQRVDVLEEMAALTPALERSIP